MNPTSKPYAPGKFLTVIIVSLVFGALFTGIAAGIEATGGLAFQVAWYQIAACIITTVLTLLLVQFIYSGSASHTPITENISEKYTGTVKWFNPSKGFGFITSDDGKEIFVHYKNIEGSGKRILRQGQKVSFVISESPKGPHADCVQDLSG